MLDRSQELVLVACWCAEAYSCVSFSLLASVVRSSRLDRIYDPNILVARAANNIVVLVVFYAAAFCCHLFGLAAWPAQLIELFTGYR